MRCLFGHKWNGCKCEKCGKTRDKQHDWEGCICKKCGKPRNEQHDWDDCICKKCGKKSRSESPHDWAYIKTESYSRDERQEYSGQFYDVTVTYTETYYRCQKCGMEKKDWESEISGGMGYQSGSLML